MTIKFVKDAIFAGGRQIGKVSESQRFHGTIKATLENGTIVHAGNKKTLAAMVARNL